MWWTPPARVMPSMPGWRLPWRKVGNCSRRQVRQLCRWRWLAPGWASFRRWPARSEVDALYRRHYAGHFSHKKRGNNETQQILNSELSYAIASMGHGDHMIVCEPASRSRTMPGAWTWHWCPTSRSGDRADRHRRGFHCRERLLAAEMAENNPPLLAKVKRIFADSNHEPIPHAQILGEMAPRPRSSCAPAPLIRGAISCSIRASMRRYGFPNPG